MTKDNINKPNPKHYKFELRNVPVIIDGEEKIVDVYINSLRKKIDIENKYIHTVRGFGYMFQYKEA